MRLINADNLLKIFDERLRVYEGENDTKERYAYMAWLRSWHAIKDAPTIDAVEVVRCKDCVYWKYRANYNGDEWGACLFIEELEDAEHWTEDTGFCSYGERSEE